MATQTTIVSEAEILAEVIAPEHGDLPSEVARYMLRWKLTDRATQRIQALSQRNSSGTLSEPEQEELYNYLRVGQLVNLLRGKAQLSLKSLGESPS